MDKIPFDPYDFFGYLASGAVVILGMQFVFGFPVVLGTEFKVFDGILLLLAAYAAGHMMASPAKALLEGIVVDKILKRPSINLLEEDKLKGYSFLEKRKGYSLFFPDYYTPLPDNIRQVVIDKKNRGGVVKDGEPTFLKIRFADDIQKDDKLMAKLSTFLTKYGFARNLSFTCLLFAVAVGMKAILTPTPDPRPSWTITTPPPNLTAFAIAGAVAAIGLFYRYLKFFRQYSFELFNAYGGKEATKPG